MCTGAARNLRAGGLYLYLPRHEMACDFGYVTGRNTGSACTGCAPCHKLGLRHCDATANLTKLCRNRPSGGESTHNMYKFLMVGILLGAAAAVAVVYFVPAVDQHREISIIAVAPDVGKQRLIDTEQFHVNVPMDRILMGASGQSNPLPPGLEWPDSAQFANIRAELFKIRNARDAVVGIASRMAASSDKVGDSIEWVLHLPARGSAYVMMRPEVIDGALRIGRLRAGTREFDRLRGRMTERWVPNTAGSEDAPEGHFELVMTFVGSRDESQ